MQPIHLTLLYFSLLQSSVKALYSPAEVLNQKGNVTFRCFVWGRGFYSQTSACVSSFNRRSLSVHYNNQRFMWYWVTHWQKYLKAKNKHFLNIHHKAKSFSNRISKMWKVVLIPLLRFSFNECSSQLQVEYYVCLLCSTDNFAVCQSLLKNI